jgi:hypothetical protein
VTIYTVDPGARVLWCLRRRTSDVRCVLHANARPIEVHVLQDRDLVIKERFTEETGAVAWAQAYGKRLRDHGWRDIPQESSPSSAA